MSEPKEEQKAINPFDVIQSEATSNTQFSVEEWIDALNQHGGVPGSRDYLAPFLIPHGHSSKLMSHEDHQALLALLNGAWAQFERSKNTDPVSRVIHRIIRGTLAVPDNEEALF